jgi:hypothetical protein
MNGDKRYHGEIMINIGPNEARINVFGDNLQDVFKDLGIIHAQFGKADPVTNPAKREIVNAERKAKQLGLGAQTKETDETPCCEECKSQEFMEFIIFTDKKTGKPRGAWKCQMCKKWHWPNGKNARS